MTRTTIAPISIALLCCVLWGLPTFISTRVQVHSQLRQHNKAGKSTDPETRVPIPTQAYYLCDQRQLLPTVSSVNGGAHHSGIQQLLEMPLPQPLPGSTLTVPRLKGHGLGSSWPCWLGATWWIAEPLRQPLAPRRTMVSFITRAGAYLTRQMRSSS